MLVARLLVMPSSPSASFRFSRNDDHKVHVIKSPRTITSFSAGLPPNAFPSPAPSSFQTDIHISAAYLDGFEMSTSPISPSQVLSILPSLLPTQRSPTDPTATIARETDAVVLLIHGIHSQLGFKITGGDDEQTNDTDQGEEVTESGAGDAAGQAQAESQAQDDTTSTFSETPTAINPSSSFPNNTNNPTTSSSTTSSPNPLPRLWSHKGEDSYTLLYTHPTSSLSILIKIGRIGGRVNVLGMIDDDGNNNEPKSFTRSLGEIVREGGLPWPRRDGNGTEGVESIYMGEEK